MGYGTCFIKHKPFGALRPFVPLSSPKQSIRTIQDDLHIEMCLETKFYIFWNFFTIFKRFLKISFWYEQFFNSDFTIQTLFIPKTDFEKSFKNSKKIPKNVKFGLEAHFDMENTLST